MKHITGQGPVYIMSTKKFLLDDGYNMNMMFEWKSSSEHSSVKFLVDNDINLPPSSSKAANSCLVQSGLKVYPICFK